VIQSKIHLALTKKGWLAWSEKCSVSHDVSREIAEKTLHKRATKIYTNIGYTNFDVLRWLVIHQKNFYMGTTALNSFFETHVYS
jgi:hypothetical protein